MARIPRKIKKALKHLGLADYPNTKWIKKAKQQQKKVLLGFSKMAAAFAGLSCVLHQIRYGWIEDKYPKGGLINDGKKMSSIKRQPGINL